MPKATSSILLVRKRDRERLDRWKVQSQPNRASAERDRTPAPLRTESPRCESTTCGDGAVLARRARATPQPSRESHGPSHCLLRRCGALPRQRSLCPIPIRVAGGQRRLASASGRSVHDQRAAIGCVPPVRGLRTGAARRARRDHRTRPDAGPVRARRRGPRRRRQLCAEPDDPSAADPVGPRRLLAGAVPVGDRAERA